MSNDPSNQAEPVVKNQQQEVVKKDNLGKNRPPADSSVPPVSSQATEPEDDTNQSDGETPKQEAKEVSGEVEETAKTESGQSKPEKPVEKEDRKWLVTGAVIVFALLGLFSLARFAVPRVLVYLTQAAKPTDFSLANSYVFGAPLSVPADGKTKIRVSAFLLNDEGRGVPDRTIDIVAEPKGSVSGNLQLKQVQPTTDKFGKAVFEVTSENAGQYEVKALVGGIEFPQTVTLTFR